MLYPTKKVPLTIDPNRGRNLYAEVDELKKNMIVKKKEKKRDSEE